MSVSFVRSNTYTLFSPGAPAIILLPSLLNLTFKSDVPEPVGTHAKLLGYILPA